MPAVTGWCGVCRATTTYTYTPPTFYTCEGCQTVWLAGLLIPMSGALPAVARCLAWFQHRD